MAGGAEAAVPAARRVALKSGQRLSFRARAGLHGAAVLLLGSGCVATGRPLGEVAVEANATIEPTAGLIVVGDELEVKVPPSVDWTHTTRVRPDGKASFLVVGDLPAAGQTTEAVARRLAEAYRDHIQKPEVTVFIRTPAARSVVVMGEVRRPGEITVADGRLSLIEAIGRAGGPLKDSAQLESTVLVRWLPKENRQVSWLIDASRDHWGSPTPLYLQPFDVVFVPNTAIDRANIFVEKYINRMIPLAGSRSPTTVVASY